MRTTFHGVRGSVPAPGPGTAKYGGNTSCVEVALSDGSSLILDAGTGLRGLGADMMRRGVKGALHLLLSHVHWDHIQGLPFFAPVWLKDTSLCIHPLANEPQERFRRQLTIFDEIHFPVRARDIPARIEFAHHASETWRIGSATITRISLNHPGGAQGFRIVDADGSSVAYLTDNEISAAGAVCTIDELARFADGVDVLIHDSQYLAEEMPAKRGWGHSVVDEVFELGKLARPKRLVLYHHDPARTDTALDALGERAKDWFAAERPEVEAVVAHEGLALE